MTYCSKSQSIGLKEIGYDKPCEEYYLSDSMRVKKSRTKQDWNVAVNSISRPTIYDAVEYMDERGVYIIPVRFFGKWKVSVSTGSIDDADYFYTKLNALEFDSRILAMSAGLDVAIEYFKAKK